MTDDFLHNLRTSHRQRFDRNRKPYDNPQYRKNDALAQRDRKSNFGRRGMEPEAVGGLKKLLEGLLESQKSLTQAIQDMAEAQQRQAVALERIAGAMAQASPPVAPARQSDLQPAEGQSVQVAESRPVPVAVSIPPEDAPPPSGMEAVGCSADDTRMLAMIEDLQKSGCSLEKIARHLEHQQVPTPSGRGHWRGSLVSRILKHQAVAAAAE